MSTYKIIGLSFIFSLLSYLPTTKEYLNLTQVVVKSPFKNIYTYLISIFSKSTYIQYFILDSEGNQLAFDEESVAIETQLDLIRKIRVPEDTALGKYVLYTKINYNGQIASASSWFNVGKKPSNQFLIIIIIIIIIMVVLVGILIEMRKIKKHLKHPVDAKELIKKGYVKKK